MTVGTGLRSDCRGQVLTMAALLFPTLLAVIGLSLDGGNVYQMKRRMQTAADSAALGGAQELWRLNNSLVESAAKDGARLNGFSGDGVRVYHPPISGSRKDNTRFVEVVIERDVPSFFLRLINRRSTTVRSRAVAGLVNYADGCVFALDPTLRGALKINGSSTLTSNCGVMVNSDNERAILVEGGGCLYADKIGVTGGYVANGSANCISGDLTTDVMPAMDPLAYLTPPSLLSTTNVVVGFSHSSSDEVTIDPGRYVGGIQISGGIVRFGAGVYILDGGGFKVSGNAQIYGAGVMFYNTNTSGVSGLWGDFDIGGSVLAQLSAPTSGTYQGVLFWNDKNAPDQQPGSVISGTTNSTFEGAFYFPSTNVTYTGTANTANWTMIVAKTVTIAGNSVVNGSYSASSVPPPTRKATLVE